MNHPKDSDIASVLMDLAAERGPKKSFCPSEAARRLSDNWRPLMPEIRRVAADLELCFKQGGRTVDPARVQGPVWLSIKQ